MWCSLVLAFEAQRKMISPPFICVCSVLITVVGAVELNQEISVSAAVGKEVSIHCTYGTGCWDYIHWYQKKEGESFKRILYIDMDDGTKTNDPGYEAFQTEKKGNKFTLKIPQLKSSHAAVYYCACWDEDSSHSQNSCCSLHKNYDTFLCMLLPPQEELLRMSCSTTLIGWQQVVGAVELNQDISVTAAVVVGAVELNQEISVSAAVGKEVLIHCNYGAGCGSYIHWYQKKEGESFKRILYVDISSGAKTNDAGYQEFKAEKNGNKFTLKVTPLKASHAAEYYCACWDSSSHKAQILTPPLTQRGACFVTMSELTAIFFLICFGFTSGDTGTSVTYPKIWTVVKLGRTARIDCEVDSSVSLSNNPLHWYKRREGEAFTRLLYLPAGRSTVEKDDGVKGSVTAGKKGQTSTLTISNTDSNDNAVYYCAVWSAGWIKRFGGGTKLFVTERAIRAPTVSVYSTSKAVEQKITFLCHASDMFPDIIRFTWQEKTNGQWVDVKKDGLELLEGSFSKDDTRTSMMLIDQQKAKNNQYACTYTHEANKNAQQSERVEIEKKASEDQGSGTQKTPITQTCPPAKITNETANIDALTELFGAARSLYLATWVYTMMIFKSMVYFCAVSYFLCTRKMGGKPSGNRRAP
ncbi:uncharacterized protein LOC125304320 [Alosa alosa]|nr:uncharacterized protein LOC125304320 [Alosa alosa]